MTKRNTLPFAAAALSALAFTVLPAMATAAEGVEGDGVTGETFSGTFGTAVLTKSGSATTVICTGENHINGKFTSPSTGTLHVLFTTCKSSALECHTSGLNNGEITVAESVFHLGWATTGNGEQDPGILITPPENGVVAKFSCFGVPFEVKGNGVVGRLTAPACGMSSSSLTMNFAPLGTGIQEVRTFDFVTNEGNTTEYSLTEKVNGGSFTNAAEEATTTVTLTNGLLTLTCL